MLETMVAFNLIDHLGAGAYAAPPGRIGYARASSPFRRPFPTRDGFVCILPYDDRQVLRFFTVVGRPELMQDPRFASYAARAKHPDDFYRFVMEWTPQKTTAEWIAICEAQEIPCMPIVDIEDLPYDAHLKAVGMFEPHRHPTQGDTVLVRSPIRFGRTPTAIYLPARARVCGTQHRDTARTRLRRRRNLKSARQRCDPSKLRRRRTTVKFVGFLIRRNGS